MNTRSVHNDVEGPYLFLGGPADGARYSVNGSRDAWVIPGPAGSEPTIYHKRRYMLNNRAGALVTIMVASGTDPADAERSLWGHIVKMLGGAPS